MWRSYRGKHTLLRSYIRIAVIAIGVAALLRITVPLMVDALKNHPSHPSLDTEARRLAQFSFKTADPASYWGEDSASVGVVHERFDTVFFCAFPRQVPFGYVALGMKNGEIICFFIYSRRLKRVVINEKTFRWEFHRRYDGPPDDQIRKVAEGLTEEELENLRALSILLREPGVASAMRNRVLSLPTTALESFSTKIMLIADTKQNLEKVDNGTTETTAGR